MLRYFLFWGFKFFLVIVGVCSVAKASLQLPTQMTLTEREKLVRILGLGLSPGLAFYLVPLGGYEGAELSFDYHTVQTKEISGFGSGATSQEFTSVANLTISKGLYNNIDLSFSFNPGLQEENLRSYSALGRWAADLNWQIPATYGVQLFAHGMQVQNSANMRTVGFDSFAVYYLKNISVQGGVGIARSIARFTGGSGSITDSTENQQIDLIGYRWFAGLGGREGRLIWGVEASQYEVLSFNTRIGMRF